MASKLSWLNPRAKPVPGIAGTLVLLGFGFSNSPLVASSITMILFVGPLLASGIALMARPAPEEGAVAA